MNKAMRNGLQAVSYTHLDRESFRKYPAYSKIVPAGNGRRASFPRSCLLYTSWFSVPEHLQLPEKAVLWVHGRLDITEGKPVEPTLVRARIHAETLAWNKVPVKTADVEAEYRPNQLFVQNCRMEMELSLIHI